jgi:hypothetical protein
MTNRKNLGHNEALVKINKKKFEVIRGVSVPRGLPKAPLSAQITNLKKRI